MPAPTATVPDLRALKLVLTAGCNLRCGMCPVWGSDDDVSSLAPSMRPTASSGAGRNACLRRCTSPRSGRKSRPLGYSPASYSLAPGGLGIMKTVSTIVCALAFAAAITLTCGIYAIHRLIDRRIDELGRL